MFLSQTKVCQSYSLQSLGRIDGQLKETAYFLLKGRDTSGNYWHHGQTAGAEPVSGQQSRSISQAPKRPLWADRRTHTDGQFCLHVYL